MKNIAENDVRGQLSFREKLQVNEIFIDCEGAAYGVCPRCGSLIEIEYVSFCSQCGQKLGWRWFFKAKIVNQ